MALEILAWLLQAGRRPALISRGYKGLWEKKGGILSDGTRILGTWEQSGDEPFMIARRLRPAGVFVGKNRLLSCLKALEQGFDVAVLDDGFQHRRLARDVDIVLFSPGEKRALRESPASLKRADLLLVKKDYLASFNRRKILGPVPKKIFSYEMVSQGFYSPVNHEPVPGDSLRNKRILAFSGIARPRRLLSLLKELRLQVVAFLTFPDHHPYPPTSLERIGREYRRTGAEAALTTEKDSVRLEGQRGFLERLPVFYIKVGLVAEPEFYEELGAILRAADPPVMST